MAVAVGVGVGVVGEVVGCIKDQGGVEAHLITSGQACQAFKDKYPL